MEILIQAIQRLVEDNDNLKAAGVIKQKPETWRPDLVRRLGENNANDGNTRTEAIHPDN